MKETWKDIDGWSGYYQVSSYGRIRSVFRVFIKSNGWKHTINSKLIKLCISKRGGYPYFNVNVNGSSYKKVVHQEVAKVFIDNPNNLPQVNHIDGNPKNNHVDNLEWCTSRENSSHAFKHSKQKASKYTGVYFDNKRSKKWRSTIWINGKAKYLGRFYTEKEASMAYKNALLNQGINNRYA